MQREDGRRQPRSRKFQPLEQQPHQQCITSVEPDVDEVVTQWMKSPKRVFNPESGINQWKILGLMVKRKPDALKTVRGRQQWVLGNISIVVPDEIAVQGGPIRDENRQHQKKRAPKLRLGYFFHCVKPIAGLAL